MSKSNFKLKANDLLTRFELKKTDLRLKLVQLFLEENRSFTQAEILEKLEKKMDSVDRVSVYRNLNQLKSSGIVHEIENNKYVCCAHDCEKHAHVLLYCQSCEKHNEVKDHDKLSIFFKAMGSFHFLSPDRAVFLKGICQSCAS